MIFIGRFLQMKSKISTAKKFYSTHLYKSWVISYLTILILPLLLNLLVYFQAEKSLKQENQNAQFAALSNLRSSIDEQFSIVSDFAAKLSSSSSLGYFLNADGLSDYTDSYDSSLKATSLNELLNYCEPIDSIMSDYYVFSLDNNLVWHNNGIYDISSYTGSFLPSESIIELENAVRNTKIIDTAILTFSTGPLQGQTILVYPLPSAYYQKGFLAAFLDTTFTNMIISQTAAPYQAKLAIINKEQSVTIAQSTFLSASEINVCELKSDTMPLRYNNNAWIYWMDSEILPIRYFSVASFSPNTKEMLYLRLCLLISICCCFIGGGILIFLFARRNYKPIREMVNVVQERSDTIFEKNSNEYQLVSNALKDIYERHASVQDIVTKQNQTLYSYYLSSLLRGKVPFWAMDSQLKEHMENDLSLNQYALLVVMIDFPDELSSEHQEILGSAYTAFSETQLFEQLSSSLGKKYTLTFTQTEALSACIISIPSSLQDLWQQDIRNCLTHIASIIKTDWKCNTYYTCSNLHHGISELSDAYNEAVDLMSLAVMHSDMENIVFIEDSSAFHYTSTDSNVEQLIINYIRTSQETELIALLTETLNKYVNENLSFHTVKGLSCNLMVSIIHALDFLPKAMLDTNRESFYHLLSLLVRETSYEKLKKRLTDAAYSACTLFASIQQTDRRSSLIDRIESELSVHLYDENLNITFLAQNLGMNAKYLSASYLEATGENLIDVIHKRRIDRFKELLATGNYSVKDASQKVGYSSVVTMNRWFKKYEGTTPGKFKPSI